MHTRPRTLVNQTKTYAHVIFLFQRRRHNRKRRKAWTRKITGINLWNCIWYEHSYPQMFWVKNGTLQSSLRETIGCFRIFPPVILTVLSLQIWLLLASIPKCPFLTEILHCSPLTVEGNSYSWHWHVKYQTPSMSVAHLVFGIGHQELETNILKQP